MKNKSEAEIKAIVTLKKEERTSIQNNIADITKKRQDFIVAEKLKTTQGTAQATLESEIEKIIKKQAIKFNLVIK